MCIILRQAEYVNTEICNFLHLLLCEARGCVARAGSKIMSFWQGDLAIVSETSTTPLSAHPSFSISYSQAFFRRFADVVFARVTAGVAQMRIYPHGLFLLACRQESLR